MVGLAAARKRHLPRPAQPRRTQRHALRRWLTRQKFRRPRYDPDGGLSDREAWGVGVVLGGVAFITDGERCKNDVSQLDAAANIQNMKNPAE